MPKRNDIQTILMLGAGPIVIGQACEFDYAGVQACKALKEEGYRVVLVNSNPATVMTDVDPKIADATYIEPLDWRVIANIIEQERPDAILPTMGGQTALNCALALSKNGILKKFGVEMIGVQEEAIEKAEDRERFRQLMHRIGLATPTSGVAHTLEEALKIQLEIGFPAIIRPSFTLGGSGGGIAYNREEFIEICEQGLEQSPTKELLIEESILGWKEFELEVVRDAKDNCIIVCSIENFDPMGIHTGDSITVAPAQTLTDKEYQVMRNAAFAILREIGVTTGGSNVQFGVNPKDGRLVVIEMNPRVSRSSALASKATGFPIARVAAKLAVGYTLDELGNALTGNKIPCSFEPTIDYVVTKLPRFSAEKFPQTDHKLTTQMKSVGEVMAMGRSFQESLQKAIRSLETNFSGLDALLTRDEKSEEQRAEIKQALQNPTHERLWMIADAFRFDFSLEEIYQLTCIDPWFLDQIRELIEIETTFSSRSLEDITAESMFLLKQKGFSDAYIAKWFNVKETELREKRLSLGIRPVYKRVDSCAAEFSATTAYLYSTYEYLSDCDDTVGQSESCEARPTHNKKIMVLGSGPNRIGQGIEFDYCCVHAALALRSFGYETIMVNCNPETVSTDFDISDRLYFEPLTFEDVLAVAATEKPDGIIVQYGGQTPLKLAHALEKAGYLILGTSPDAIDRAEDRERFHLLVQKLHLQQPPNALARNLEEALTAAEKLGFPILIRPSYVLGGRAMQVVCTLDEIEKYIQNAVKVSNDSPILLDRFLEGAIEIDVDALCDGQHVLVVGIMEHIEEAGVHSGDSSCVLPPHSISKAIQAEIRDQMHKIALELGVVGLINAQFAIQNDVVYVLEVNPRASRTIPFVSKATGLPLVHMAVGCMLHQENLSKTPASRVIPKFYSVKEPVFPFNKFPGVDAILGPEMKSTGEVMGVGNTFPEAFAKGQLAAGNFSDSKGYAFLSVRDADKPGIVEVAQNLIALGFTILATRGTAAYLAKHQVPHKIVNKVLEGRPHIVDMIKNAEVHFIINTTEGNQAIRDSYTIRRSAIQYKVSYKTTLAGGKAAALARAHDAHTPVRSLQTLYTRERETEKIG
jgi:carbamoyl-phosphate synthase large subunit